MAQWLKKKKKKRKKEKENPLAKAGDTGSIPGWEDPLEKERTTHSSILVWEIPWTEEPGGLQSMVLWNSQTQLSYWACTHITPKFHSDQVDLPDIFHPICVHHFPPTNVIYFSWNCIKPYKLFNNVTLSTNSSVECCLIHLNSLR